ncbi:hypothetical protein K7X08_020315 [Anisodus acutangulus]|uniref:Uncharacterized protein n=1 Tax=Anisodus acutangulus TaxID=402998 RepID=A0A9Q1REE5_9SOLA|nr:hypothetical protein K7X08_020315 [Anisodus acutangulus]
MHQELMNLLAFKTGACLFLIPPIPSVHLLTKPDHAKDTVSDGPRNILEMRNCGEIKGAYVSLDMVAYFCVEIIRAHQQSFTLLCKCYLAGEDPTLILYTSGTTGKPKGVVHTHKGILAQVQILAEAWEYTSKDRFLHCSTVPTMYTQLIQCYEEMDPELKATSASAARHLCLMMCGSSALPLPVMQQWETITGHWLLEHYGMMEFVMAISNPIRGKRKAGTVGKSFPGVQAKILLDDESGTDKSGVGELCIKNPSFFKDYWKLPKVTIQSFTDDGFFKTGEAVTVDEDGNYIILGRTNADIMKVGGYKFSALEIEAVLLEHPAISECCVLGLPDKDYGEVVCAIVVPYTAQRKEK